MKAVLKSTTILGAASLAPIIVGLVSAKAWAHLVGPSGYGFLGLVQSLIAIATLTADLGISTTLIKTAAAAVAQDPAHAPKLWRAGVMAALLPALLGAGILLLGRRQIAMSMLGGAEYAHDVMFCALTLLVTIGGGLAMAMLNAHQRIGALAKVGVWGAILPTAAALLVAFWLGIRGLAAGVAAGALVRTVMIFWFLWRETKILPWSRGHGAHRTLAVSLARQGVPLTLSQLAGTGVQLVVPVIVLHLLGVHAVGFYGAAYAIAVGSLGFLLTAFAQDYLPRVASVAGTPEAIRRLANEQHRVVILIGFPLILCVKAAAPVLIPMLYNSDFTQAKGILTWILVADLLKFSSWTLSYLIFARCRGRIFLFTELLAGVSLVTGIAVGGHFVGVKGIGIGFLFSYVLYWAATWLIAKRQLGFSWDAGNLAALGFALLGGVSPQIFGYWLGTRAETLIAFAVAAVASLFAVRGWVRIWRTRTSISQD